MHEAAQGISEKRKCSCKAESCGEEKLTGGILIIYAQQKLQNSSGKTLLWEEWVVEING
jgi:hypothetical protein